MQYPGLGKIHVITGTGRGKTPAALGFALRALAEQKKTAIVYFDNTCKDCFSPLLEKQWKPYIDHYFINVPLRDESTGSFYGEVYHRDIESALVGLQTAEKILHSGKYDFLILEEINWTLALGMIPLEDFLDFLNKKPAHLYLILTGRHCPDIVMDKADLVTEIRDIK